MKKDKFGLNKNDFESYRAYRKEYNRLLRQSQAGKLAHKRFRESEKGRKLQNANIAKYRAGKACVAWSETEAIKQFYLNCPPGCDVDHDIPKKGKNVSGLHVLGNLQYLTRAENKAKGNKFPYYTVKQNINWSSK